jgi:intracellular multiplication protein IcmE
MAFSNLFQSLSNTKTRTMVLFGGILVAIGVGITMTQLNGKQASLASDARTLPVPENIKAIPGNVAPEQYEQLLKEDNQKRVDIAKKSDASAIPTILGSAPKTDTSAEEPLLAETLFSKKELLAKNILAGLDKKSSGQTDPKLLAQQDMMRQQQQRIESARQQQKDAEDKALTARQRLEDQKIYQQSIEKMSKSMETQTKVIFNRWSDFSKQMYKAGMLAPTETEALAQLAQFRGTPPPSLPQMGTSPNGTSQEVSKIPEGPTNLLKAGTILFGVIDTAINSDEPGPVMATIVDGPYKGARLLGNIQMGSKNAEKVVINFNTLSIPLVEKSVSVSIVAIDPDTARTALASNVDHHYLTRYGFLFASAFMEGYGKAIQNSGSVATNNPGSNTTTTTSQTLNGKQEFRVGLGTVGQKWGKQVGETFGRPPTITVNSGTGVGLLLLEDIKLPIREG